MNKRITVIIIAVLVVLLAAILIAVGVKSCDGKKEDGYDDLNVSVSDDDIGEVYDVETGEVVENSSSDVKKGEIKVPETVDEGDNSSVVSSSSNPAASSSPSSGSSSSSDSSNGGTGSSSSSSENSSSSTAGGTDPTSLQGYQALQPI